MHGWIRLGDSRIPSLKQLFIQCRWSGNVSLFWPIPVLTEGEKSGVRERVNILAYSSLNLAVSVVGQGTCQYSGLFLP